MVKPTIYRILPTNRRNIRNIDVKLDARVIITPFRPLVFGVFRQKATNNEEEQSTFWRNKDHVNPAQVIPADGGR